MEHLSLEQLERFREGSLAGADLLAVDDHVAACEACREKLDALPPDLSTWTGIARGMHASAGAAGTHLSYERLQACVDGAGSAADEAHLAECHSCREEAENLKSFTAQWKSRQTPQARFNRYLIVGPIAAVLLVGVLLMRPHGQPVAQPIALAVSVRDGGKTIGLDRQGHLVGEGAASPAAGELLASALRDGKVSVNVPDGLRGSRSVLLGAESAAPRFRVQSPVGQLVLEAAPVFQWDPLPQARAYQVQIFDADYQPVAASPQLAGTQWTPEHPLERGKRYAWQVTAIRAGSPVKAPEPPDAEARFQILGAAEASAIAQARQAGAGHLQMTALYAQAGLCREAAAELDALAAENPTSQLPQQLRASLASQCAAGR